MGDGIAGDPDAVEAAAAALGAAGHDLQNAAADTAAVPNAIPTAWTGQAAEAGITATSRYGPAVDVGAEACTNAQRVLHTYAQELRAAQQQYAAAQDLVTTGMAEPGGATVVLMSPQEPTFADTLSPGARDVLAGQAGMREAVARAETANRTAARAIDVLVTGLDAMKAPMPRTRAGTNPAAPFGYGRNPTSAPPDGKQCAETLSCTIDDFQHMSVPERRTFVNEFIRLHGGTLGVADRYNNVKGVLHFFTDDKLGKQDTWVSWVDASILHGIERGAATNLGLPGGTQGNPGGANWKKYFDYVRRTGDNDSDHADQLWRDGEEASTRHGYAVSLAHGSPPSLPDTFFTGGGEVYRLIQRHETAVKGATVAAGVLTFNPLLAGFGPSAVNDFMDPHNSSPSYLGGHVFHGAGSYVEGYLKDHVLGMVDPIEKVKGIKEQIGGAVEVGRYGGEGVVRGGGWAVHEIGGLFH